MNLYSFTPFHPSGLGYAYNAACSIVPHPEDWVVLMDADVMMLPGNWGNHLLDAIGRHPEFSVLVCMATRTWERGDQQLREPEGIRDCRDLGRLFQIVAGLAARKWADVVPWPAKRAPSGFFMALRRAVWDAHKFPLLGVQGLPKIGIETAWFRTLPERFKVGLMTGLAAVHFYRLDRPNESPGYLTA